MWVFGYGSLMWDGWETKYGFTRKVLASLAGFHRVFNKSSISRWGTRDCPCPTLNLVSDPTAVCRGIAFEFPEGRMAEVLAYLKDREGLGFSFPCRSITLANGNAEKARVPIFDGIDLMAAGTIAEMASKVRSASGTKGKCIEYVRNIAKALADLGITDSVVEQLSAALEEPSNHSDS